MMFLLYIAIGCYLWLPIVDQYKHVFCNGKDIEIIHLLSCSQYYLSTQIFIVGIKI